MYAFPPTNQHTWAPMWKRFSDEDTLERDHIDVWRISLAPVKTKRNLASILSKDEISRAKRLVNKTKGNRFLMSRLALREILSRYIGVEPQKITFRYSEQGKPSLDPSINERSIEFNLSHSENMMLLAISRAKQVGIDIEAIRPMHISDGLLRNYFSSLDAESLSGISQQNKLATFYELWTRKEAHAKACGLGIGKTSPIDCSHTAGMLWSEHDDFLICTFEPHEDFIASLAVKAFAVPILHFYDSTFGKK